jgi:SAM-dependent methyltransferase
MNEDADLHGFLEREGYLIAPARAVERRLRRVLPPGRLRELRAASRGTGEGGAAALHRWPRTAEEAHLLLSYDVERVLVSFDWLADGVLGCPAAGEVVDLGCATGSLLRHLRALGEARPMVGIDAADNLVGIARELSAGLDGLRFLACPYAAVPEGTVRGAVLVSACGLDLDPPETGRAEHEAALAGRLDPARAAFWSSAVSADLAAWHRMALPGAELRLVARLPLMPDLMAFLAAAAGAGWLFQPSGSRWLPGEFPPLPALSFRRAEPHPPSLDAGELSEWQRLHWPSRDEDLTALGW